jgi:hypothetical protein
MIPVNVTYTGDPGVMGFKILASRFASDQESLPVDILKSCTPNAPAENQPASFQLQDGLTASLCLRVPQLSGDGKYLGNLTIFPDNKKPEAPKRFSFSRALTPPATLSTDHQAITIALVRPLFLHSSFSAPLGSVALQEKSGKGPARGVAAQIDSGLKTPGDFDPVTGLTLQWNGQPWNNPFSTPPLSTPGPGASGNASPTTIDPGAQAEIGVTGKNLQPGEYVIPFRFSAPAANTDNAKFSLTVDVRDSVLWAIAALLAALLLSFVITKVLTGKRRRITLLQEIQDLKVSKGTTLPRLPAVVWVEAVLNLTERLSSRFWLSSADIIEAHINSVRSTVDILKQVRELRGLLQLRLHNLIFDRAAESIDRVLLELGTEPPDDAMATRIKAELTAFNDWLGAATFPTALWNTIQPALQKLQKDIDAGVVPDNAKEAVKPLRDLLNAALAKPPQTSEDVQETYRRYARLRILWDCRTEADAFAKLIAKPEPDLQECFRIDDDLAWEQVKAGKASLKIRMPVASDPDGLEAFTPLAFSVTSANTKLSGSYLFHRKVEYAWKFTLEPGTPKWHEALRRIRPKQVVLTPTTFGPSVVQYFPRRGTIKASVTLSYTGDPIEVSEPSGTEVSDSSDFGLLSAFEGVEYISWAIAAAVALATGLSTYYFKNPTFGSYQDYLTLMLWGVGMDQGKNFLQALQAVSSQPAAATPPATTAH